MDYRSSLPRDLEKSLLDDSKYQDFVNQILSNNRTDTRQKRKSLENYITDRIYDDFFLDDVSDENEGIVDFKNRNQDAKEFVEKSIEKGVDPLEIYELLSAYTEPAEYFREFLDRQSRDGLYIAYDINELMNILDEYIKNDEDLILMVDIYADMMKDEPIDKYNLTALSQIKNKNKLNIYQDLIKQYLDEDRIGSVIRIVLDISKNDRPKIFRYLVENATDEQLAEILDTLQSYTFY